MLRKEYVRWFLKFCFIIVMTIIVLPVLYTYFYHHITGMPKAIDGILIYRMLVMMGTSFI